MNLQLIVLKHRGSAPERPLSHVFEEKGGSIGRGSHNDWVFPDPNISRDHARVSYRHGCYYLVDTSLNGVFVNESSDPLGPGVEYEIRNDDHFRIGSYLLVATMVERGQSDEKDSDNSLWLNRPASSSIHDKPASSSIRDKIQRARKPRVHITFDIYSDNQLVELPFTLCFRDVKTEESGRHLEDSGPDEPLEWSKLEPSVKPDWTNLPEILGRHNIKLKFDSIKDFERSSVVKQGSSLRQLLTALRDFFAKQSLPYPVTDNVQISVSAPASLTPGNWYTLDTWIHTAEQRTEVLERANEEQGGDEFRIKSKGPLPIALGTVLTVKVELTKFDVSDNEDTIVWQGNIGNASFGFFVPVGISQGTYPGLITVFASEFRVAKIHITLKVADKVRRKIDVKASEYRYSTAFASYASSDRDDVLGRVQGMQKIVPGLDVFLDVISLRSGDN